MSTMIVMRMQMQIANIISNVYDVCVVYQRENRKL